MLIQIYVRNSNVSKCISSIMKNTQDPTLKWDARTQLSQIWSMCSLFKILTNLALQKDEQKLNLWQNFSLLGLGSLLGFLFVCLLLTNVYRIL